MIGRGARAWTPAPARSAATRSSRASRANCGRPPRDRRAPAGSVPERLDSPKTCRSPSVTTIEDVAQAPRNRHRQRLEGRCPSRPRQGRARRASRKPTASTRATSPRRSAKHFGPRPRRSRSLQPRRSRSARSGYCDRSLPTRSAPRGPVRLQPVRPRTPPAGVESGRDFWSRFANIREVRTGDTCRSAGERLCGFRRRSKMVHIFKLEPVRRAARRASSTRTARRSRWSWAATGSTSPYPVAAQRMVDDARRRRRRAGPLLILGIHRVAPARGAGGRGRATLEAAACSSTIESGGPRLGRAPEPDQDACASRSRRRSTRQARSACARAAKGPSWRGRVAMAELESLR